MPGSFLVRQGPDIKLDLRGLIKYAKKKGVKVIDLTEGEKASFVKK